MPVAHTICDTFAVTVTLPTVADADTGPNVEGAGSPASTSACRPRTSPPPEDSQVRAGGLHQAGGAACHGFRVGDRGGGRTWPSGSHTVRAPCAFGLIVQEPGINNMAQGIAGLLDSGEFEQVLQRLDDE
ncbi:hypothetical protein [Streptomyces sp. NPDC006863]|uniref:hypothetical protein n=1 Tax=unclassified Streptomyces TaxID=2593676 RepID=UPI0033D1710C